MPQQPRSVQKGFDLVKNYWKATVSVGLMHVSKIPKNLSNRITIENISKNIDVFFYRLEGINPSGEPNVITQEIVVLPQIAADIKNTVNFVLGEYGFQMSNER